VKIPGLFSMGRPPARFRRGRDRGGRWILRHLRPDGSIDGYYKALSTLIICDHTAAAHRMCDWIASCEMTPDGDFGRNSRAPNSERFLYRNAWIVLGAHRLGRLEIARPGMEFIMGRHDPDSGGFYSGDLPGGPEAKQDLMIVAFCGLAALAAGRHAVAQRVGGWLRRLREAQPSFPERLFTVYSRAQGLHLESEPGRELRYVVVSSARHDQLFFQVGIAAAFLGELFRATADPGWLALARDYMRLAEIASDDLFRSPRAGKVGWAAATLHPLTGDDRYRQMALRVGANLLALQQWAGSWADVGAGRRPSADVTAEMPIWLDAIEHVGGG
jgi:hypothetical protein